MLFRSLVAGHGIIVMVDTQAFLPVYGGPNGECAICFEPGAICFTSCGHAVVCTSCVEKIGHGTDKKVCPMCREPINWAVEVKTDTTPEVEERPPKTAKLSQIEEELNAEIDPGATMALETWQSRLLLDPEERPKPTSNGAAAGPSAAAIDSDAEPEVPTRENSPDFDWKAIDINDQDEYWDLVAKMDDRLGPRNLGKYVTSTVWDTLKTLPKHCEKTGLSRVARTSDMFP